MITINAVNWFVTQPIASLTNALSQKYLLVLLNDPVTALAELMERQPLRLANALQVNCLLAVTADNTELLTRLPVDWCHSLERLYLTRVIASQSILPLTANFTTLPDGSLPAVFTGATWTIASGKAVNTPTEGAEKLTDGGFEVWTNPTNLTNWTETLAGTSTVNQETSQQRTGSACARLDIDASNSNAIVSQSPTVALNDWCILRGYARSIPTGKGMFTKFNNQLAEQVTQPPLTTSYQLLVQNSIIRVLAGFSVQFNKVDGASSSLYCDDFSLKKLTTADLPATLETGQANGTVKANWTIVFGTHAGVIMNLDSVSSPANWVALIQNGGTGNLYFWKCVAGTISQVATGAVTYVAGAAVELRKTAATTYQMYYNSVKIGTDQTISDAGIISNTRHGLLSAYPGNQCSFFSAA